MGFKLSDVFVTGGEPTVTYVRRPEHRLEEDVRSYLDVGNSVLAVSGASKSGKSTLVNRVLRQSDTPHVRVTGASLTSMEAVWQIMAHRLSLPSKLEVTAEKTTEFTAGLGSSVGGGVIPAQVAAQFNARLADRGATLTSPTIALSESVKDALIGSNVCLVIDDFHYAPDNVRQSLAQEIKDLVFNGARVILIAIPQRVMDILQAQGELVGRVTNLRVEDWQELELLRIATQGFEALNVTDPSNGGLAGALVPQSYGSPLLMQELCRRICLENRVLETVGNPVPLQAPPSWHAFYREAARNFQPDVIEHLKVGPVERRRRTGRALSDGSGKLDMYSAVLVALARKLPQRQLTPVELSDAMNEFLETRPQLEQVRRACRQMAKIARDNRGKGDAGLDYRTTPERLSVVDPYLAFFIAWALPELGLPAPSRT